MSDVGFPVGPSNLGTAPGSGNRAAFPDPYLDYASTQMPRSISDVMKWCEYVWLSYGTYRMAAQRVVRYFLTKVELTDASDDEKQKYEDFCDNRMKIMNILATLGDNYMAYGNAFVSLSIPFRRYLACPRCNLERPISKIRYTWKGWNFHARCENPKCRYQGAFRRVDRPSKEADPPRVIFWSPHEIKIQSHIVTGKTSYFWQIPGYFSAAIKSGEVFYLENTPWEIIDTIKAQNKLFRFNDDVIYHLKDESVAGLRVFGWGVPLIMANFKQAWYLQVLKRYNEAIALDYIIPFRVITPQPGSSREADPILHVNMNSFNNNVMAMFRKHRRDPTSIHALPFPVNMQMLGADGKALAPNDLIDKGTDEFLNAQGVPAELYRGTLQIQAMPAALRLFERTWVHLVNGYNSFLTWLFKAISEAYNWENLKGRLQPVTLADSLEDRQTRLQLAAGNQISRQTAYAPFGINIREEIRRMLEEQQFEQEEMAKHQEDMQQRQQLQDAMGQGGAGAIQPAMAAGVAAGQIPPEAAAAGAAAQPAQGAAPPGAVPPPMQMDAAPGGSVTPDDMMAQAEQMAYQLVTMPYEARRSQLLQLKKSNETLHSLVIAKMDTVRQDARSQGQQVVLQRMAQGGQ